MGILTPIFREGGLGCKLPIRLEHLPPLNFGSESYCSDYELTESCRYQASSVILSIGKMKRGWNRGL
ncbi:hypothetical protein BAOM_4059 [Peribacillus asahii]|uniref:Uncharacterized protein n=1 Tax=Peribacillus asahii TaxID=228899 RepID=A0A3Q9RR04_9BACI|nr:hypothetical protein BAOM_4059 [Peribacillus asahii]